MKQFNGPKFQQGKMGGDWSDTEPDAVELAKKLARKAKISSIIIDEEEILYIHIELGRNHSYTDSWQYTMGERVLKAFKDLTGKKAVVGFKPLTFSGITKKQAFRGKLNGQLHS